jgi:twitching motility protein PilT
VVTVNDYLQHCIDRGGSDLHLKAGGPAYVRIDGELKPITHLPPLSPTDTEQFANEMMDERNARMFDERGEADFATAIPGVARFRVNAFRQRGAVGLVLRLILSGAPGFEELGLPPVVRTLADEHRGLVLVTGPTGSGKTTTTAAMIGHINRTRRCHIVTIEDPIEVMHRDDVAIVDQREIGVDTRDFPTALRAVSRQDPDVIFIGEMRDIETVSAALQAAETGHMVISTLHTTDAAETVHRVIDMFPKEQQYQARLSLGSALKGIVSQRLVSRATGQGRIAVIEAMVMTARIQDRRALLDHDAVVHEHDPVGDLAGEAHLVGDHHHRHALLGEVAHDGEHLADQLGVEGGGGLVEQHHVGSIDSARAIATRCCCPPERCAG